MSADDKGKGKGKSKGNEGKSGGASATVVNVSFGTNDVRVIQQYYGAHPAGLPPGLQKKLARTGQLPPGWQRRIEPIPVVVERQLVVLPADYRRGVIDGNAVIYSSRRGIVFDATVLF